MVASFILVWLLALTIRFLFLQPPLSLMVYPSLLRALFEMNFGLPEGFVFDSVCLFVSLGLHIVVGVMAMRFWLRLPILLEVTCGVFLGIGIATFVLEFFAIFFVLNFNSTWLVLLVLIALLSVCQFRWGWASQLPQFQPEPLQGKACQVIYWLAFFLLALITVFTFYHALMFPVDYWDALILYINYGKMTYEQDGFPILYCLQVGLGLGANYPHLYPLFQAVTAALFENWSTLYGQAMPPLASLGTLIVLYYLILYYFRSHLVAILSLLAFRQITYVTSYFIWASDYALVMQYTAIYLFFLAWFLKERTTKSLQPLLLVSAIFPHINYLGWIVWFPSFLAMLVVWFSAKTNHANSGDDQSEIYESVTSDTTDTSVATDTMKQFSLFPRESAGVRTLISKSIISPPHPNLLPQGEGTNPLSLWERVGVRAFLKKSNFRKKSIPPTSKHPPLSQGGLGGIFILSSFVWFSLAFTWYARNWIVTGNPVYAFFPEILGGKNINLDVLRSSENEWMRHGFGAFHLGDDLFERLINTFFVLCNDYRFAPVVIGLLLPSLILGWRKHNLFFGISGMLFLAYVAYQYLLSGFYFYHILAVFPILCLFAARFLDQVPRRLQLGFGVVLIISGIVPGLSFAIMGTKNPLPNLPLLSQPGMSPMEFYLKDYEYADVASLWRYLNNNAEPNAKILSHDNRYLVFRDDLQIIHLDDCDLVPFYGQDYPQVHQELLRRGIQYYLYIPSEDAHPITRQLGHRDYLDDNQYYTLISQSGEVQLYKLNIPEE